ncbi:MAG TPA: protein kinase [Chthoniobacterales bacterium]|nr:protein kinase [Chthoniobacterales bacterium]
MIGEKTNPTVCEVCGSRIESTASGEFGCLVCLLRDGLGEPTEAPEGWSDAPPLSLGQYVIMRREDGTLWELGRGAMGVTYRAQDPSLQREVALKIIKTDLIGPISEARERFMREARAAAALRHPSVATVYQFGIDEASGQCFCAMELVEGETLDERVRRTGPLDVPSVIEIAQQITAALTAAERHGLVHRDLKPANVMIVEGGEPGGLEVKIIDFGLAKALGATTETRDLTHGGFVGTPAFASPEQLRDAPVDVRSDIYSLGAMLWYLLSGHRPFGQGAPAQAPVEQLKVAQVPSRLATLLVSMVAPEPAVRPGTQELAKKLRALNAQVSSSHWWNRKKSVALMVVLVLLTAAFLLFVIQRERSGKVPEKSLAVLPFENESDDRQNTYFADGMQDDVMTGLAQLADLRVINRASVQNYRDPAKRPSARAIGEALGVAYLVEGSVRRQGDRVRINARLIQAASERQVWAADYDRQLSDVFAIQSEVARQIADELQLRLSATEKQRIDEPPTRDFAAYELYLHARELLDNYVEGSDQWQPLNEAVRLLNEATARDPQFALAWCGLASAHSQLYQFKADHTPARLSLAGEAVQKALALRPDLGEPHLAAAIYFSLEHRDDVRGRAELGLARAKLPNNAHVALLSGKIAQRDGRWAEMLAELERSHTLNPRDRAAVDELGTVYDALRRYDEARRVLDQATAAGLNSDWFATRRAAFFWHDKGDTSELRTVFQRRLALGTPNERLFAARIQTAWCDGNFDEAARLLAADPRQQFEAGEKRFYPRAYFEGMTARARGDQLAARIAFTAARPFLEETFRQQPDNPNCLIILAEVDAALGNKEQALAEANRAVAMQEKAKNAWEGSVMLVGRAQVYAWAGEHQQAIAQLESLVNRPRVCHYGYLKMDPDWVDLRGEARFQRLVESLAPARGQSRIIPVDQTTQ